MILKRMFAAALGASVLAGAAAPALAQDAEEAVIVQKIRAMAVGVGNAYACTSEESRDLFREESHHLFDLIVQDAGSDVAFIYAVGLGYGAAAPADVIDCERMLGHWETIRTDYDLKADE
ncbi:MAG: hypothetical protein AAGI51_02820 [Pseudomonadota bacterium]